MNNALFIASIFCCVMAQISCKTNTNTSLQAAEQGPLKVDGMEVDLDRDADIQRLLAELGSDKESVRSRSFKIFSENILKSRTDLVLYRLLEAASQSENPEIKRQANALVDQLDRTKLWRRVFDNLGIAINRQNALKLNLQAAKLITDKLSKLRRSSGYTQQFAHVLSVDKQISDLVREMSNLENLDRLDKAESLRKAGVLEDLNDAQHAEEIEKHQEITKEPGKYAGEIEKIVDALGESFGKRIQQTKSMLVAADLPVTSAEVKSGEEVTDLNPPRITVAGKLFTIFYWGDLLVIFPAESKMVLSPKDLYNVEHAKIPQFEEVFGVNVEADVQLNYSIVVDFSQQKPNMLPPAFLSFPDQLLDSIQPIATSSKLLQNSTYQALEAQLNKQIWFKTPGNLLFPRSVHTANNAVSISW